MNATEAIAKAATHAGWSLQHAEVIGSRAQNRYAKGRHWLFIQYKLYGTPVNYMLRYYGKDPADGINWGIETAHIKMPLLDTGDDEIWVTTHIFEGANKKRQVLAYLKGSADGST